MPEMLPGAPVERKPQVPERGSSVSCQGCGSARFVVDAVLDDHFTVACAHCGVSLRTVFRAPQASAEGEVRPSGLPARADAKTPSGEKGGEVTWGTALSREAHRFSDASRAEIANSASSALGLPSTPPVSTAVLSSARGFSPRKRAPNGTFDRAAYMKAYRAAEKAEKGDA